MDNSGLKTAESRAVAEALEFLLEPLLLPEELLVAAAPATWRDQADLHGPGTFQGALFGTSASVIFLFSKAARSTFSNVDQILAFPTSNVAGASREMTFLTSKMGYRVKAPKPNSHHLAIRLIDGDVLCFYMHKRDLSQMMEFFDAI
jgi:hypothetical protein